MDIFVGAVIILVVQIISGKEIRLFTYVPIVSTEVENEYIIVKPSAPIKFIGFGANLEGLQSIAFSTIDRSDDASCENDRITSPFAVEFINSSCVFFTLILERFLSPGTNLYICTKQTDSNVYRQWRHRATIYPKGITLFYSSMDMPIYVMVVIMLIALLFSACFSGLHIGLLKLDKVMLQVVKNAGSPAEQKYASVIMPVRENGNRLLCTLLLSNVAVNVIFSIMADKVIGTGILAIVSATFMLLIFAELLPQSLCTNYGLLIGAKTIILTQFLLFFTAPVSYPVSLLLDRIFGEEIGQVYNREKLKALILTQKNYGCVDDDEVNIITGALSMNTKTAEDVMTSIENVYMLPLSAVLDFQTTNDIITHGYTRIPVYEGDRSNICTVLNVKDLAFVDPNDKIPVSTVCKFYNRKFAEVEADTPLCEILRIFKQGSSHIAVITEASKRDQENGPKARSIGVVTLEDIIEEILQEEIIDETDMITVKSFHSRYIHMSVLQSFLNGAILKEFDHEPQKEKNTLYAAGRSADYAILVLQGNLLVEVSEEHLQFEAGAFMFFGETIFTAINRLIPELPESCNLSELLSKVAQEVEFVPDYTVTLQSTLQCLEIKAEHYLMARYLSDCVRREPNPDTMTWLSQSNYFKEAWESRYSTNIGQAFKDKARSLQPTG
ncbi:hypothetical protein AHF37_03701 [Paragonimus kellicotti]|nr:hypothetical protein AHF37_03701 [Paragonimus kellicotti]